MMFKNIMTSPVHTTLKRISSSLHFLFINLGLTKTRWFISSSLKLLVFLAQREERQNIITGLPYVPAPLSNSRVRVGQIYCLHMWVVCPLSCLSIRYWVSLGRSCVTDFSLETNLAHIHLWYDNEGGPQCSLNLTTVCCRILMLDCRPHTVRWTLFSSNSIAVI